MSLETHELLLITVGGLIGIAGSVATALVNHFLIARRERASRLSDFRGFLGRWLSSTIQNGDHGEDLRGKVDHLIGYYYRYLTDFDGEERGQIVVICEDIVQLAQKVPAGGPACAEKLANRIRELAMIV